MSESFDTKPSHCTACKRKTDAAMRVNGDGPGPREGDITVCFYCGHVMSFAADLSLRELSIEEIRMVAGDKRILAIQRARGELERQKKEAGDDRPR